MKIFRLDTWFNTPRITEVECERVNEKSVFFQSQRVARKAFSTEYFDDYESAKQAAVEFAQKEIGFCKRKIEAYNQSIKKFEAYLESMEASDDKRAE